MCFFDLDHGTWWWLFGNLNQSISHYIGFVDRKQCLLASVCLHLHLFMVIVYECQYFASPTTFADGNSYMELFIVTSQLWFFFSFVLFLIYSFGLCCCYCCYCVGFVINFQKLRDPMVSAKKKPFFFALTSNTALLEMPNLQACRTHTHHPFLAVDTHIYFYFLLVSFTLYGKAFAHGKKKLVFYAH